MHSAAGTRSGEVSARPSRGGLKHGSARSITALDLLPLSLQMELAGGCFR